MSYEFIRGPLDGHTAVDETATVWPDGTLRVRIEDRCRAGYWLLYRGETSFIGGPIRMEFVDWMPVDLHPTNTRQGGA